MGQSLPADQRAKQEQQLQQNFYRNFGTVTKEVITDEKQRDRFNQLALQYRGYEAFNDPQIQEKLKLTEEQQTKFRQFHDEWTRSMNEFHRDYGKDSAGVEKRFNEARQRELERMNQVLNENQRQTWRQLTGDPYQFNSSIYFQTGSTQKQN